MDQAAADKFRAMLTAVRDLRPWAPAHALDATVCVGPFMERAHPRPGDDHDTGTIAVALIHPGAGHAAACLHGRQLGCTDRGRLRCEPTTFLGTRQPAKPAGCVQHDLRAHSKPVLGVVAARCLLQPVPLGGSQGYQAGGGNGHGRQADFRSRPVSLAGRTGPRR
ncbi:hypothetical protein [Streptomyces uncialis]|uniref:hypothetical protein n=1 Tax=Streptomyces uncialis TaxID=1048205 RepID=UPI00386DC66E|nr:hypothetical protein OG924_00525 [Streptomyces uncialis]